MDSQPRKIVILGAGFAGMYVLRELKRLGCRELDVTIINPKNYFLFTPLLHEVATGNIAPENVTEPIRSALGKWGSFIQAEVVAVRLGDKRVETTLGSVPYDQLIIALGSKTNFFNTPGAEKYALELKTLRDAQLIKNRIIENLERASLTKDSEEISRLLSFVVVGGGPTGVELAGELADFLYDTFGAYYPAQLIASITITLVERGSELLPQFSPRLRRKALAALELKGVRVVLNSAVEEIGPNFLQTKSERLDAGAVIWTAGVAPRVLEFDRSVATAPGGHLMTDQFLQLQGEPDVYVLGDMACHIPAGASRPLPGTGQVATKQAVYLARSLVAAVSKKAVKPYHYQHSGSLVSVGGGFAMGEVFQIPLAGFSTWWLWRWVYWSKLISFPKQLQVALDWIINTFLPRDIADYYDESCIEN